MIYKTIIVSFLRKRTAIKKHNFLKLYSLLKSTTINSIYSINYLALYLSVIASRIHTGGNSIEKVNKR